MALNDAQPIESPPGMAVAINALLAELLQTLIDGGTLSPFQVITMITNAHRRVAATKNNPAHADAVVVLKALQERFPFA
jgi:hypothetical protein